MKGWTAGKLERRKWNGRKVGTAKVEWPESWNGESGMAGKLKRKNQFENWAAGV